MIHVPTRLPVLFTNPITRLLILLQIPFILSAVFAVNSQLSWPPLLDFLKVLLMALMILVVVQTERDLQLLLLIIALSVGAVGAKFGLWGIYHGGVQFNSGYGGMMSDNNALALALTMCIPLCWFGRDLTKSVWIKWALTGAIITSTAAIIMTYSRGAAICLAVGVLLIAWRSRHRFLVATVSAVTIAVFISLVGLRYMDRLATLRDVTQDGVSEFAIGSVPDRA